MTTMLIPSIPSSYLDAAEASKFFSEDEKVFIRSNFRGREERKIGDVRASCDFNLFFGFFFDGTKNNYIDAEHAKNHSNVARLYDCFPGQSVFGVLPAGADWQHQPEQYNNYFRVYVPGVATKFSQVGDSGEGYEQKRGAAFGAQGEQRIVWALIQAINNVHRFFLKQPLISSAEAHDLANAIAVSAQKRHFMQPRASLRMEGSGIDNNTRNTFAKLLTRLHANVSNHWPDPKTGKPKKIDPGIVRNIYISIFGFSRGATEARAFTNWLHSLCGLDAELRGEPAGLTLGGFKVHFDFLGLFDTVASVGAGNTLGNSIGGAWDGHGAWADADDSLRIQHGIRCVHLVAAHEVRRSFPLDSISFGTALPENCDEVVVPGVHSDLGGGYAPTEQGRGTDPNGADMMSRVPLIYMYKMARLAGVPLKLEFASAVAKGRFKIEPTTITAMNAYLACCKVKAGTLAAIMREQQRLCIEWRVARRADGSAPLERTNSFLRATTFDQNDLHSANLEFDKEVAEFEKWLLAKGAGFQPKEQPPGYNDSHAGEWEEIATWWKKTVPPATVMDFFDNYVHDSRAWFKVAGKDNEPEALEELKIAAERRQRLKVYNDREANRIARINQQAAQRGTDKFSSMPVQVPVQFHPISDGFSPAQRAAIDEYLRTNRLPRMITEGREPFSYFVRAGYLRYRKVYAGGDSILISQGDSARGSARDATAISALDEAAGTAAPSA